MKKLNYSLAFGIFIPFPWYIAPQIQDSQGALSILENISNVQVYKNSLLSWGVEKDKLKVFFCLFRYFWVCQVLDSAK